MHSSTHTPVQFSLVKRSNGRYAIRYYGSDGRRCWRSTGVTTKREALRFLAQLHDQLDKPSHLISLDQFASEFLEHVRSTFVPKTVEICVHLFRTSSGLFPSATLSAVLPRHMETFKPHRKKLVRPVNVYQELSALQAAFDTATCCKLVRESPVAHVVKPPSRRNLRYSSRLTASRSSSARRVSSICPPVSPVAFWPSSP